jgi:DNA-binding NarL/FixJ family response regulator
LEEPKICVLIVEDYEPFRRFTVAELQSKSQLHILNEICDGAEAVQQAQQLQPDLILLDIGLPTLNGIEAARRIQKVSPHTKILFVSENRSSDLVEEALRVGGLGYIVKSDAARDLLPAIEAVLRGKRYVSASLPLPDQMTSGTGASEDKHRIGINPYLQFRRSSLIPEFLASIIEATGADFGNIQLFDSTNGVLRIVAQHGFEIEFLSYFDTVGINKSCVCGEVLRDRSRLVVADVATDPLFTSDARGVLLRAKVRSVQSTPLIDAFGNLIGTVSTHYCRTGGPLPHMWSRVDDLAASFLASI